MKNTETLIRTALAGLVAAGIGAFAATAGAQKPEMEKCYGVAKAGKNDCQTQTGACAGTAKKDRQADAWIFVPKGTCAKIAGGDTKEPAAQKK